MGEKEDMEWKGGGVLQTSLDAIEWVAVVVVVEVGEGERGSHQL